MQVLITIVVLTSFLSTSEFAERLEIVELFGGEARIARMGRQIGMTAVSHDITYHGNKRVFDLTQEPGFVFFG